MKQPRYVDLRYKRKLKNEHGIKFIKVEIPDLKDYSPLIVLECNVNDTDRTFRVDMDKRTQIDCFEDMTDEQNDFLRSMIPIVIDYLPKIKISYSY